MTDQRLYRGKEEIFQQSSLSPSSTTRKKQFFGPQHTYQSGQKQHDVPLVRTLSAYEARSTSTVDATHTALLVAEPWPSVHQPVSMQPVRGGASKKKAEKLRKPKRKRARRWVLGTLVSLILVGMVLFSQANGQGGAWAADTLRAIVGPTITAQVESWYLGLSDTTHRLQYQAGNQHVTPPWAVGAAASGPPLHIVSPTFAPMSLTTIPPLIPPAISGEGVWIPQQFSLPTAHIPALPLSAKAFLRPDPNRPYAIVTLLAFDTRLFLLHIVAGTTEPGGPRGMRGPGVIPAADQASSTLLAAFNGGFKYADGQYGLAINGTVYVPPQPKAATIAITKKGQLILGAWGIDPRLNMANTDLVAWRQNAALLIDHGVINPLTQDGAAWGGTILNSTYTWRSGLGITAQGALIYAAGDSLSALTLGQALHAAGAVMAMQTDINPFWVRAFLYNRDNAGNRSITKLNPAMQGTGYEYLSGTERDFFYLTRIVPTLPPPPKLREATPQ